MPAAVTGNLARALLQVAVEKRTRVPESRRYTKHQINNNNNTSSASYTRRRCCAGGRCHKQGEVKATHTCSVHFIPPPRRPQFSSTLPACLLSRQLVSRCRRKLLETQPNELQTKENARYACREGEVGRVRVPPPLTDTLATFLPLIRYEKNEFIREPRVCERSTSHQQGAGNSFHTSNPKKRVTCY